MYRKNYNRNVENSLKKIYSDKRFSNYGLKPKKKGIIEILSQGFIIILIIASLLSWTAYILYSKFGFWQSTDNGEVSVSLSAPKTVEVGELTKLELKYRNLKKVGLKNVEIKINWPKGFEFKDSVPQAYNKEGSLWKIDKIGSKRSNRIEIRGIFIGSNKEKKNIYLTMNYWPNNFNSEFTASNQSTVEINQDKFNLQLKGDKRALVGEVENYQLDYNFTQSNNSFSVIKKDNNKLLPIKISLIPAVNMEVISCKPKSEEYGEYIWNINNIKNGKIIIKAKHNLKAKGSILAQAFYNNNKIAETLLNVDVIEGKLISHLIVNGSSQDSNANLGDKLNYSLTLENKGDSAMGNLIVMAVIESDFIDWSKLNVGKAEVKDVGEANDVKTRQILWSKEELPELEKLAPKQKVVIDFSAPLVSKENIVYPLILSKKYQVKAYGQISVGTITDEKSNFITKTNQLITKINSDTSFKDYARYFDNNDIAVGWGSLPPKVGETTAYRIYWKLENELHDIKQIKITGQLANNVKWSGKSAIDVGEIKYDESNRKIVWQISKLPKEVGQANANFEVQVTPSLNDENKVMILLKNVNWQAIDNETGAVMSGSGNILTTELQGDKAAQGKGVVE